MANIVLATPILSDAATITGSEGLGDMTIGNLQKRSLKRPFRTDDIASAEINIDLGSAKEINLVALIGHNGSAAATVVVKAGTTSGVTNYASSSLPLISGADLGYSSNIFFLLLPASQTYRYWKFEIADAGNADGYLQFGRLYISKCFQPSINIDYNEFQGFIDNSRVSRTTNGEPVPLQRDPYKVVDFTLSFGSKDEMYGTLYEIDRLRGLSKDVLYINDPAESDHLQRRYIYGLMSELNPIINTTFRLYQKKYKIEEIPQWPQ